MSALLQSNCKVGVRILNHPTKNLKEAFCNDEDIHVFTASLIYGIKEEDVEGSMRDFAKRVNFGIVYGITSFGLARDLGISNEEAQQFIDTYFARYPKVPARA